MTQSTLTVLVLFACLVSLAALALSYVALRALSARRRGARSSPLPLDVAGLRGEVEHLRQEAAGALRHLAVVRYDAFGDMGGRLSWSMAVLDEQGDGAVLTSIHGRSDARAYAKTVAAWSSDQALSPEAAEVIAKARTRVPTDPAVSVPTQAEYDAAEVAAAG